MQTNSTLAGRAGHGGCLMAVVLGTALSTLGPSPGVARAEPARETVCDLSRYCNACWRNARLHPGCWEDCTQEVLCRLLQRVPSTSWGAVLGAEGAERREFLRAIDAVKKRTQRQRHFASAAPDSVADRRTVAESQRREVRQDLDQAGEEVLSPRQRRILGMSMDGWSIQDMAAALRIPAERVSDEKYKTIQKLRSQLSLA
jgi:RNA polymerase sigma factor (sigma-70 family)